MNADHRRWALGARVSLAVAFSALVHCGGISAQSCPPAPLVAAAEYPAAPEPTSTAIGDFTNDGKSDVVVTTAEGLLVFPGNGDGTLGAPILSSPNTNATGSIAFGHFTGGPNLDIAVADQNVYVMLGNGDGTFQAEVEYPGGTDVSARIATGLFNGDDHLDLVETDGPGKAIHVFLGNGDGTFVAQTPITVTGTPVDVAVADFNGDGHPDLAVAIGGFDGMAFQIFLGNGDGTFAPPIVVPTGAQPTSIAAADLAANGHADVVVGESSGVELYRGNGNGSFQPPQTFPTTGNSVSQVLAADLDGDGLLDVVAFQPGALLEILQAPDNTFAMGPGFLAAGNRLGAGDLNGDGLPDFALPSFDLGLVEIVLSSPGTYLAARSVAVGLQPLVLVAGDFDGDGQADLAVSGSGASSQSAVILNKGGAFQVNPDSGLGSFLTGVAADVTGDGKMDLVVADFSGITVEIGNGDGTFTPGAAFPGPFNSVVVADFNGDGIPDVAAFPGPEGGLSVFLGVGGGAFMPLAPEVFPSLPPIVSIAAGDFDGDGVPDLVVAFSGFDVSNTVGVLLGNGDGSFHEGGSFLVGVNPFAVSVGDFNEDGHLDVVAANGGSTNVSLLLGDGAGGFSPAVLVNVGAVPVGLAVADIDGDGHLDLATANSSAFVGGISTSVLLGDGSGGFRSPIVYRTAQSPQAVAVGAFGPQGRVGVAIAADFDWFVDIFLNGALSSVTASGAGTVIVGSPTVFSVAATSGHPLTYQWRKGGVPLTDGGTISGATSSRLRIDPVSFADAGSYDVIVTDACTSATSDSASLAVEFADVPTSSPFHADILTIATEGITSGCGGGNFCPTSPVRRDQMAVFLLKSEHGASYLPPACSGVFADVPCPSAFADWIEQLAAEHVTSGCGNGNYCPDSSVTRAQMAVFLLKTSLGSSYSPPPATGIFGDVPIGSFAADFIEDLYHRNITGGCHTSPLLYCPDNPVLRQQMAILIVRGFAP